MRAGHPEIGRTCHRGRGYTDQPGPAWAPTASMSRLVALHEHNEASGAARLVMDLRAGKSVAYISDAGTPGISDPGARDWSMRRARAGQVRHCADTGRQRRHRRPLRGRAGRPLALRRLPAREGRRPPQDTRRSVSRPALRPGFLRSSAPHRGMRRGSPGRAWAARRNCPVRAGAHQALRANPPMPHLPRHPSGSPRTMITDAANSSLVVSAGQPAKNPTTRPKRSRVLEILLEESHPHPPRRLAPAPA
jgi:hypothetical protein